MATSEDLAELIEQYAAGDGVHETALPRVALIRASQPTEPLHALHQPALCIVAQGRKRVMLGAEVFVYDPAAFLVVSVDLPIVGEVLEASPARPYLCLRIDLEPTSLGAVLLEFGLDASRENDRPHAGLTLGPVTPELLDAAARLVRLLGSPKDAKALAPLAEREILYRLASSAGLAKTFRQIAMADGRLGQINRAIDWIKRNFREPFQMEKICSEARMSPSALHAHFRTVTAMSPLQYQKQLRLQEARRLILSRAADAAGAGHAVGYDSPSQFSREYRRMFGAPPMRDGARLRERPISAN